jgi:hypothetical protein
LTLRGRALRARSAWASAESGGGLEGILLLGGGIADGLGIASRGEWRGDIRGDGRGHAGGGATKVVYTMLLIVVEIWESFISRILDIFWLLLSKWVQLHEL